MEEVVDTEIAHLGLETRPKVEDCLRAARRELRGLTGRHVRRLAGRTTRAEQLLGADQGHVEKLARQVFEAGIA